MSEQLDLFGGNDSHNIYSVIEPALIEVLDKNTIDHKYLQFRQNKGYNAVAFRNVILFTYKIGKKTNWLHIPFKYKSLFPEHLLSKCSINNGMIKFNLERPEEIETLGFLLANILDKAIDDFPKDFGCCSRYVECSNLKKCINPNKELAMNCQYKINLKQGRIFYGVNAKT